MQLSTWIINQLDRLFDLTLKGAVLRATRKHLTPYGYSGIRSQHGGIQYIIQLRYCRIGVWLYKDDLGSAITPISADSCVYQDKIVAEVPMAGKSMRFEMDRQIKLIVEEYQMVLRGDFGDWPLSND